MSLPQRKHPRLPEYDYSSEGMYFLTICASDHQIRFSTITKKGSEESFSAEVTLTPAGKIVKQYIVSIPTAYPIVSIISHTIMPDHIHLILQIERRAESSRPTIPQIVAVFKRLTNQAIGRSVWQSSYYDHIIRSQIDLETKINYIETNPLRYLLLRE